MVNLLTYRISVYGYIIGTRGDLITSIQLIFHWVLIPMDKTNVVK